MLVTAKGFSGGLYPMSAVVTRPECFDFFADAPFRTISSFAWSNIGARITCAALEETERLLPRLRPLGDSIAAGLQTLQQRHATVLRSVRRAGMMFALDFAGAGMGMGFLAQMLALGVLVVASSQRMDIIKLYPPFILEDEHVAAFCERMEAALQRLA